MSKVFKRYQLEAAVNQYMIDHDKRVFFAKSSAKNCFKLKNIGLLSVIKKYFCMIISVIQYSDLRGIYDQYSHLCQGKIE